MDRPTYEEVAAHVKTAFAKHHVKGNDLLNDDPDPVLRRFNIERIRSAIHDIRESGLWSPLKGIAKKQGTSYGQKHTLERWRTGQYRKGPSICRAYLPTADWSDYYVTNGEFIMAMSFLGYKLKAVDSPFARNVNFFFNARVAPIPDGRPKIKGVRYL